LIRTKPIYLYFKISRVSPFLNIRMGARWVPLGFTCTRPHLFGSPAVGVIARGLIQRAATTLFGRAAACLRAGRADSRGGGMTQQAVTLMADGKPASPPSHSPWKTLRVSHRLTASTTGILPLTSYRSTSEKRPVPSDPVRSRLRSRKRKRTRTRTREGRYNTQDRMEDENGS